MGFLTKPHNPHLVRKHHINPNQETFYKITSTHQKYQGPGGPEKEETTEPQQLNASWDPGLDPGKEKGHQWKVIKFKIVYFLVLITQLWSFKL